ALLRSLPEAAQIGRQALHAKTLAFTHPKTSERMSFESEYPNDMIELQKALRVL
ncbi:MAG: RNA pseudouridine synthase, partial [Pseudomonadota bacterium]